MSEIKRGRGRPRKVLEGDIPPENTGGLEEYLPGSEVTGLTNADDEIEEVNDSLENVDIVSILSSPEVTGTTAKIMKIDTVTLNPHYLTTIPAKSFNIEIILLFFKTIG